MSLHSSRVKERGSDDASCEDRAMRRACHVGKNICENYPRWIGKGLNDASCMLGGMLSSFMGFANPAWVILANAISHMAFMPHDASRVKERPCQVFELT